MEKRILAIFAHPDDETFGPSGTLARYAQEGARVRLITATKGEAGKNALNSSEPVGKLREQELLQAAEILGIEKVTFLGYIDKTLNQIDTEKAVHKILTHVDAYKPQIIITYGPTGISRHPDHLIVHHWANRVFHLSQYPQKIYYYTLPREVLLKRHPDLGVGDGEITTRIDVRPYLETKKSAILTHQTQRFSIERIFDFAGGARPIPQDELFVLGGNKLNYQPPKDLEPDLFAGMMD